MLSKDLNLVLIHFLLTSLNFRRGKNDQILQCGALALSCQGSGSDQTYQALEQSVPLGKRKNLPDIQFYLSDEPSCHGDPPTRWLCIIWNNRIQRNSCSSFRDGTEKLFCKMEWNKVWARQASDKRKPFDSSAVRTVKNWTRTRFLSKRSEHLEISWGLCKLSNMLEDDVCDNLGAHAYISANFEIYINNINCSPSKSISTPSLRGHILKQKTHRSWWADIQRWRLIAVFAELFDCLSTYINK